MGTSFTVITGASSGIGRAMAYACAQRKHNLVLVARNGQALAEICADVTQKHGVQSRFLPLDLQDAQSPSLLVAYCRDQNLPIDLLINNAGCGLFGQFGDIEVEAQIAMINLNVSALVRLCHGFIPLLKTQTQSAILNVASVAALYPLPYYSAYGATKAFVRSFSKALAFELRQSAIKVCCLLPGDTDSDFFRRAGNPRVRPGSMSPQDVADFALNGLDSGKTELFTPNIARLRHVPMAILERIIQNRVARY